MIDLDELERLINAHKIPGSPVSGATALALIAEVRALRETIKRQANAARAGMDAAKAGGAIMLQEALKARAESSPEVLASERAVNAMLTEENEALRSIKDVLQQACVDAVLALAHASMGNSVYQSAYEKVSSAVDAARSAK